MTLDTKQLDGGLDLKAIQVEEVRRVWNGLFHIECPPENQIRIWLCHDPYTIVLGLREAAQAFCRLRGNMSQEWIVRYSSKCMNSRSKILNILKQKEKSKWQTK